MNVKLARKNRISYRDYRKKGVKKIKIIRKYKEKKPISRKITINKKLPTILILHTGGTIASKVSYETLLEQLKDSLLPKLNKLVFK